MDYISAVEEVVDTLRNAQSSGRGCTLLIGAGVSVAAGIPSASGIVKLIEETYPAKYARAMSKTYPECMAQLFVEERRNLIAKCIGRAQLNWAHVCIAELLRRGYIERILTTNFDPLVLRAAAMVGEFPAVYDMATSREFKADKIAKRAVFYLHGQHTGPVILNTSEETNRHAERLKPVFEDAGRNRSWLVVGYSGENDPVFEHLVSVDNFDNGLYWVGYEDSEPASHVEKRLLMADKSARFIKGYNADSFFINLAQKLDAFPPDFVRQPFTYLDHLLAQVIPTYTPPGQSSSRDVLKTPRQLVQRAMKRYEVKPDKRSRTEAGTESLIMAAQSFLMAGEYEQVIALHNLYEKHPDKELGDNIAGAHIMLGRDLVKKAQQVRGVQAEELFEQAFRNFEMAVDIAPDNVEGLLNWGMGLLMQADNTPSQSNKLFAKAIEKYREARRVDSTSDAVHFGLGNALSGFARTLKNPVEAAPYFTEAYECYEEAIQRRQEAPITLSNWASALLAHAQMSSDEQALPLLALAEEKCREAIRVSPNGHAALVNLGAVLGAKADFATSDQANLLRVEAEEHFRKAISLMPNDFAAHADLAKVLGSRALELNGDEADRVYVEAYSEFRIAASLNDQAVELFLTWGTTLRQHAASKRNGAALPLYEEATTVLRTAVELGPDEARTHYSLARALAGLAQASPLENKETLYAEAHQEFERSKELHPGDVGTLVNLGNVLVERAQISDGPECHEWLEQSFESYKSAIDLDSGCVEAYHNWGGALILLASTADKELAPELYRQAISKLEASLSLTEPNPMTMVNWASALLGLAELEPREASTELLAEAERKIASAVGASPHDSVALCLWARILAERSKQAELSEQHEIWRQAAKKYREASLLNLDDVAILKEWTDFLIKGVDRGQADLRQDLTEVRNIYEARLEAEPDRRDLLFRLIRVLTSIIQISESDQTLELLARVKSTYDTLLRLTPGDAASSLGLAQTLVTEAKIVKGDKADLLFGEAEQLFEVAQKSDEYRVDALNSWGVALTEQGRLKQGPEAKHYFLLAYRPFYAGEELAPGSCSYNLACLSALLGDEQGCMMWLEKTNELGKMPSVEGVLSDSDFKSVAGSEWFSRIVTNPSGCGPIMATPVRAE